MHKLKTLALATAMTLAMQSVVRPALAENQMGYTLLTADQVSQLPRRGGALGMDVGRAQQITDGGMTFELLSVNAVRRGSPGAQTGFHAGDQIIAVDGHVFPSVATFAAYIGATAPGRQITVDFIPAGGGPQQAQRVGVMIGGAAGQISPSAQGGQAQAGGLSTGTKMAIGAGPRLCSAATSLAAFPVRARSPNNHLSAERLEPVSARTVVSCHPWPVLISTVFAFRRGGKAVLITFTWR